MLFLTCFLLKYAAVMICPVGPVRMAFRVLRDNRRIKNARPVVRSGADVLVRALRARLTEPPGAGGLLSLLQFGAAESFIHNANQFRGKMAFVKQLAVAITAFQ